MTFAGIDPDSFASKDRIVAYFEAYAEQIAAPIRCGVEVNALRKKPNGSGFVAETSQGVIEATNVVAATGPFQRPLIPGMVVLDAIHYIQAQHDSTLASVRDRLVSAIEETITRCFRPAFLLSALLAALAIPVALVFRRKVVS